MQSLKYLIAILMAAGLTTALRQPNGDTIGDKIMGSYVTSLEGRTRGQKTNARLAARVIDGSVLDTGKVWSFNRTVGSWTPDRGFVIAPVSYDGELVTDWGGGVCQTSTTLYNAALLAGLEIVQRNRHTWAPGYVPPGRDAAVAQREIDLQLRNPNPWPVRIRSLSQGEGVGFEILGKENGPVAQVREEALTTVEPTEVVKIDSSIASGRRRLLVRGRPGVRVTLYRSYLRGSRAGESERISQDSYPPMNRIVAVGRL